MLLREFFSFGQLAVLQEAKNGKPMVLQGLIQEAEKQNGNKRRYPYEYLKREVDRIQDILKERRLTGELDHPHDEVVQLKNASHLMTEVWMEGNQVYGKVEILPTPNGKILQDLVNAGVKVGISSRAGGSLAPDPLNEGGHVVRENLKLITWDMVSDPSTTGAFPGITEGIMLNEQRDPIIQRLGDLQKEREWIAKLRYALRK